MFNVLLNLLSEWPARLQGALAPAITPVRYWPELPWVTLARLPPPLCITLEPLPSLD
jgi:hypothetical protein